jgi:hypothetical protein
MYRAIPVEEAIAALPKAEQEAIAKRGAELLAEHDARFRAQVQEALDDSRPATPHDEASVYFAERRAAALRKARKTES